jgi:hypothetical protein
MRPAWSKIALLVAQHSVVLDFELFSRDGIFF